VRPLALEERELRAGAWTRLGDRTVLGDPVTEHMLSGLAEQAQAAARTQGYATGWAEGRRAADERAEDLRRELLAEHHAAEQRRDAEHRSAVEALLRAAAALTTAVTSVCDEVARHTVDVAAALTEELLGHELTTATAPGADAVRRALALLPEDAVVRVRLSPAETADPSLAERLGAVQVIADPSLERGDALVELVDGVLDARVSRAIARVREVLAS
jgi:flagellar assembly protein FliH